MNAQHEDGLLQQQKTSLGSTLLSSEQVREATIGTGSPKLDSRSLEAGPVRAKEQRALGLSPVADQTCSDRRRRCQDTFRSHLEQSTKAPNAQMLPDLKSLNFKYWQLFFFFPLESHL